MIPIPLYLTYIFFLIMVDFFGKKWAECGLSWYEKLKKPKEQPSKSVIQKVWPILYVAFGISFALAYLELSEHTIFMKLASLYVITLAANFFWPYIFFVRKSLVGAVIDSFIMLISSGVLFYLEWPLYPTAAYFLLPFILWITFATYINWQLWQLNK